jgi:hypothetical protein
VFQCSLAVFQRVTGLIVPFSISVFSYIHYSS